MVGMRTPTFSSRQAADVAGITYRQLDYWARTDMIRPSAIDANGSGSRRRYSVADVRLLLVIRLMLDYGATLTLCRRTVERLAGLLRTPEAGEVLVISPTGEVAIVWGVEQVPWPVCLLIDLARVVRSDDELVELARSLAGPAPVAGFAATRRR